jgi:hypothetical protein
MNEGTPDREKEDGDVCEIKIMAQYERSIFSESRAEKEKSKTHEKMPVEILLQIAKAYTRFLRI